MADTTCARNVRRLAVLVVGFLLLASCSQQTRPEQSPASVSGSPTTDSEVSTESTPSDGFDIEADRPGAFETRPPGSDLPSGDTCAKWVRATPETVPENEPYNNTEGREVEGETYLSQNIEADDIESRIDGAFVGTTDEIIQWGACKWGFDEHNLRAQAYAESTWFAGKLGDCGEPTQPETGGEGGCASLGLLQVRGANIEPVFPGVWPIAWKSTAFNVDYAMAVRRACFEGSEVWLTKSSPAENPYEPGDEWGCMGRWFSGAWYDAGAIAYMERVRVHAEAESWKDYVGCPDWKERFYCGDIDREIE